MNMAETVFEQSGVMKIDGYYETQTEEIEPKERDKIQNVGTTKAEDNLVLAYLAEMKRHPRITPSRELVLGKRISKGQDLMVALAMNSALNLRGLKNLKEELVMWMSKKRRPNLTEHEAMQLIWTRINELEHNHPRQKGLPKLVRRINRIYIKINQAKEELITTNLRLVVNIAKRYTRRGLSFSDLIQDGNLGLIKAVSKYDYSTGNRFSTYASWWIRQSITRAIYDKSRTIRLPVHFVEVRNKFFKTYYKLFKELQREPTRDEIAEAMELSMDRVLAVIKMIPEPISLETPTADDDTRLGDYIVGEDDDSVLDNNIQDEISQVIEESLDSLSPREATVVRLRFGIGVEEGYTLEGVGREFNISRERVRQIEKRALERLRHPSRRERLADLL